MNLEPPATRYPDLDTLARALAGRIADWLGSGIESRGSASLVVSGGRSPVALFGHLRAAPLDWSRVWVGLADERWVEPSDAASNERLVRTELLVGPAAAAHFNGMKNAAATPEDGAAAAWAGFAGLPRPFDVTLLGMGDDGHTASLFPGSAGLGAALDETAAPGCVGMRSPVAPEERLSLNLSALLRSRHIVMLITGDSKWRTYLAASEPGPAAAMPVRAVLRQTRAPVDVIWCP